MNKESARSHADAARVENETPFISPLERIACLFFSLFGSVRSRASSRLSHEK